MLEILINPQNFLHTAGWQLFPSALTRDIMQKSGLENQRMIWVRRDVQKSPSPAILPWPRTSATRSGHFRAPFNLILNTSISQDFSQSQCPCLGNFPPVSLRSEGPSSPTLVSSLPCPFSCMLEWRVLVLSSCCQFPPAPVSLGVFPQFSSHLVPR